MSRLQYNRSRSSEGSSVPAVDWDEVDEELSRVSPAFRDPRFDSLKHVLTVLSSENAEVELEQVRMTFLCSRSLAAAGSHRVALTE